MDNKINKVIAKKNYILYCKFNNGIEKIYVFEDGLLIKIIE